MKKVAFVGQAPPKTDPQRPFGRSALYKWLESVGITFELDDPNYGFFALIDYFPGVNKSGGHLAPTPKQIEDSKSKLSQALLNFSPDIVIPIGSLSIREALSKKIKLEEVIGKEFNTDPYNIFEKDLVVIPLPHPSGASTWVHNERNKQLLTRALLLISANL